LRLKQPEDDFPAAEELTPSEDDDLAENNNLDDGIGAVVGFSTPVKTSGG
jgi:hypothetical protein